MRILWFVRFCAIVHTSLAALVNVTIDDTYGDPMTGQNITYSPDHAWKYGPSCKETECPSNTRVNDLNSTRRGTWHDGSTNRQPDTDTSPLLASISFTGSAVYVYCIIPDTTIFPKAYIDMTFLIDAQSAGRYAREPFGSPSVEYNALVYSNQSLQHGNHTLTIQSWRKGRQDSLVLLDYIIYSYENGQRSPSPSPMSTSPSVVSPVSEPNNEESHPSSQSGKIVGGVLGSLGVVLLGLVAFLWNRQKQHSADSFVQSNEPKHSSKRSPSTRPTLPAIQSTSWMRKWRRRTNITTVSHLSFNPSIFAGPLVAQREIVSPTAPAHPPTALLPPPVTTALPLQPPPPPPASYTPLQPNRERTTPPRTPSPQFDFRNEPNKPMSILAWQQRTRREADDVPPRLDISEADISSYYEFSSDNRDADPQPPRPPPRRFTVVNN